MSKKIYTAERKPSVKSAISTIATMIEFFHLFFSNVYWTSLEAPMIPSLTDYILFCWLFQQGQGEKEIDELF